MSLHRHLVSASAAFIFLTGTVLGGDSGEADGSGDKAVGKLLSVKAHKEYVWCLAFSPDGKSLASGGGDGTIRMTETATGKELWTAKGRWTHVYSISFSPDGKLLASGGAYDHTVRIWDTQTGKEVWSGHGSAGGVDSVCFSPDGKKLAAGFCQGKFSIIDTSDPGNSKYGLRWSVPADDLKALAFSPDGTLLATGGAENTVKLWNPETGGELRTFTGPSGGVSSLAFSPDGRLLASGARDRTIRLWEVEGGAVKCRLELPDSVLGVRPVVFFGDGETLTAPCGDGLVRLWSVKSGRPIVSFRAAPRDRLCSLAVSPDGEALATGTDDGEIALWKVPQSLRLKGFTPDQAIEALKSGDEDSVALAMEVLTGSGQEGAAKLRRELEALEKSGTKNAPFQIALAWALFEIARKNAGSEEEALANLKEQALPWIVSALKDVDLSANFQAVFQLCATLARCRDPAVLPALRPLLKSKGQKAGLPAHAMMLNRQLVLDFTFGVFGRSAAADLHKVLQVSENPEEIASCIFLLGKFRHKPALADLREKVKERVEGETGFNKGFMLVGLGMLGDGQDLPLLRDTLKNTREDIVRIYALYGILEIGSAEALADVVPFTASMNRQVNSEAWACLGNFIGATKDGFPRAVQILKNNPDCRGGRNLAMFVRKMLEKLMQDYEAVLKMTDEELQGLVPKIMEITAGTWALPEGKSLSREQVAEVLADWESNRRIASERHGWVKPSHLVPLAKPEDLDALFRVRASFLGRQSDECLYDIAQLDEVIRMAFWREIGRNPEGK